MENSDGLTELKRAIPVNGLKTEMGILSIIFMEDEEMWIKEIQNTNEEIQINWKTFPHIFPTLQGHKFYGFGTEQPGSGKYYLCSTISENDPKIINGLGKRKISFGNYVRYRLNGETPELFNHVGTAISYMLEKYGRYFDTKRPIMEYYRSNKSIDCLMPIK
jgi:hypothetical protein